jgi:hypothetical protein
MPRRQVQALVQVQMEQVRPKVCRMTPGVVGCSWGR